MYKIQQNCPSNTACTCRCPRGFFQFLKIVLPFHLFYSTKPKFFQIINSIFSFRGVWGCSGLYRCEKTQQIQGFSICWAVNRLLWLAVPACSGVNGFILGRVDFLLIFPPHQHQPGTAHTSGNRYTPGGGYKPRSQCRGSSPNILKQ